MDHELTGNAFRHYVRRGGLVPNPTPDHTPPASSPTRARTMHLNPEHRTRQPPSAAPRAIRERGTPHRTHSALFQSGTGGHGQGGSSSGDSASSSRRVYTCDFCRLSFGRKHHRDRHVTNIHGKERPYICEVCGFAFHQKPNLDRHKATVHQETKQFPCTDCGLRFNKRRELLNHQQTQHDRQRYQRPELLRMPNASQRR